MLARGVIAKLATVIAVAGLSACATPKEKPKPGAIRINENPFPSTYAPYGGASTLIRGATICWSMARSRRSAAPISARRKARP